MTLQEITQLRKEGKIDEAYQNCLALYEQYPTDRYVRTAMAWCLKSVTEQAVEQCNVDAFVNALSLLGKLDLAEICEFQMANRFSWDIRGLLDNLKSAPAAYVNVANRILDVLSGLHFVKPNKYYSLLADVFLKVKGSQGAAWPGFVKFMDWFGFDNLMPEDYHRIPLQNGKSLPSLAERVHTTYYKSLMLLIDEGNADSAKIDQFINRLTLLNESHPEYQYTLYHKSLLLLKLGRQTDAMEAIKPFVQRKQSEFWVWDVLSDTTDDDEIKLSCCCRALMCNADPKFLGKVHLKTALLMHKLGYDKNARTEIRAMHTVYQQNGWNMPYEALDLVRQPWYQAADAPQLNDAFYKNHLSASESFLYADVPEVPILVTKCNYERMMCNFVTVDLKQGFFSLRQIKKRFKENTIYLVRMAGSVEEGKISNILTAEKVHDATPYIDVLFCKVDGVLKIREGDKFGFVGDVYIDKSLITSEMSNHTEVTGSAVISFNHKKKTWGWKATSLKIK